MNLTGKAIKQALLGNFKNACKTNLEILKNDPQNLDALNRLGQAYFQLGEINKAKTAYQKSLTIDRFNVIAKRNLEKLKNIPFSKSKLCSFFCDAKNFLEEPGKTKLVRLVSLGENKVLVKLSVGEPLCFVTKGKAICLYNENKEYIGRLPDDISRRLIWLTKRGNRYKAFTKSLEQKYVAVFLKEVKKAKTNNNFTSFPVDQSSHCAPFF